jgi:hypothetical protein
LRTTLGSPLLIAEVDEGRSVSGSTTGLAEGSPSWGESTSRGCWAGNLRVGSPRHLSGVTPNHEARELGCFARHNNQQSITHTTCRDPLTSMLNARCSCNMGRVVGYPTGTLRSIGGSSWNRPGPEVGGVMTFPTPAVGP